MTVFQTQIYTLVKIELESKFYYNHLQKKNTAECSNSGAPASSGKPSV